MSHNTPSNSALELTRQLIACESVTPARGAVFDVLEEMLKPLGFAVSRTMDGNPPFGPVENLFAIRKGAAGSRHFTYAGHLDVVPPGEGWTSDPFTGDLRGNLLFGRGAVDMKGSIAAFVAALHTLPQDLGTISLIITGDEEGPAEFGTVSLMQHMAAQNIVPDLCLVGEPTSVNQLGDMIKIGRRGSVNMWISVEGQQGHVAYPHLADNPVPKLIAILSRIEEIHLDDGSEWFQPSNIEITDLTVGNEATNVIPAKAEARLSIRFNDLHSGESLTQMIGQIVEQGGGTLEARISGESFLTPPGTFSDLIAHAIKDATGQEPELSTSGGTSDARFLSQICPVVEFGLRNATMHKLDEAVDIDDLEKLSTIFAQITRQALI